MTVQKEYGELVAQAERAVSSVKDAELRRVAFERVLDDLLSAGASSRVRATTQKSSAAMSPSRGRRRKRSRSTGKGSSRIGPQAYIEEMINDAFFKKQKTISEVKAELENRGHHIPLTSLSGPLQTLCQKKRLRRQKVDGEGNKKTFAYSNW